MQNFDLFCYEIETEDLVDSSEEDFCSLESFFRLELENHGHLLKIHVFLQSHPMNLLKAFSLVTMFSFLKDKKLTNMIFLLNKFFSTNNSQILFILTFLNSKHLGYFSRIALQQLYGQLSKFLESVVVIELDAVAFCDD